MTRKKTIVLNSEDFPTVKAITDSVSRLKKDYGLLSKFRGSKDVEEPNSFKSVISFLEMLIKREKRNIPKEKKFIDNHLEIMTEMVAEHLNSMDDWEMHRTVEETGLTKVFERVNTRIEKLEKGEEDEKSNNS